MEQREPAERPAGYRRPEKNRKKRTLGEASVLVSVLALLALGGYGVYLISRFRAGSLAGADVQRLHRAALAAAALGALSLVLAVVALCLRRQRKGLATFGLALGLVTLLSSGAAAYAYGYVFGELQTDDHFGRLPQEALGIVQVAPDGEVVRQTQPPTTVDPAEVETLPGMPIEWEDLDYEELPPEARSRLDGQRPAGPSYLLEGADQVQNFLLFGLDALGSSDSIILLSLDNAHQKIKMISIARDSYVLSPLWGTYNKLAYAYNWGGAQLAVSTVNQNFFLDVQDYISVNFEQLEHIVDLVGGVDVELNAAEVNYVRQAQPDAHTGLCHLNGAAALAYARIRSSDSDDTEIKRTGRQREVLASILKSLRERPVTKYPAFIRACLGMCTTSLDSSALTDLALKAALGNYTVESYALIEQVDFWGGILGDERYFYCVYDLQHASDRLYRLIYEDLYLSGYPD